MVPRVSIFRDVIIWEEKLNNSNGQSELKNQLHLLDINKDNDLLFDFNDLFPFSWEYILDSDNDEIGDQVRLYVSSIPKVYSSIISYFMAL